MSYYRENFPEATITPKLHMLEEHVIPWLQKWRIGFGFMGEQGVESVHSAINNITSAYLNIPDGVERLRGIMLEHHRQICPELTSCQPSVKKRKSS
jgi:hypothetical protein